MPSRPPSSVPTLLKLIGWAAALTVGAALPATAQNLLVNGGAESGALSPWTPRSTHAAAVASQSQSAGTVLPQAGAFFFSFAATEGTTEAISQSGTSGLGAGTVMTLSGFVSTENLAGDDFGVATLLFLDSVGGVVDTTSTSPLTSASNVWAPFSLTASVPATASSWRVELEGTRVFGTFINVFWDEVGLTASPPPPVPSFGAVGGLLLSSGLVLAGGAMMRRSRRPSRFEPSAG